MDVFISTLNMDIFNMFILSSSLLFNQLVVSIIQNNPKIEYSNKSISRHNNI